MLLETLRLRGLEQPSRDLLTSRSTIKTEQGNGCYMTVLGEIQLISPQAYFRTKSDGKTIITMESVELIFKDVSMLLV